MKQRFLVILSIIAMLSSVYSCKLHEDEDHHFKIYFENRWDKPVFINYHIDWHWYSNPYENYGCSFFEKPIVDYGCPIIQPGGIDDELMRHNAYYEYDLQDQDSVVIFVFNADDPEKKDSECFLVRYHLSKEDLQKVSFHVCYPPTEAMKDFYMKPSYEEVIKQK